MPFVWSAGCDVKYTAENEDCTEPTGMRTGEGGGGEERERERERERENDRGEE